MRAVAANVADLSDCVGTELFLEGQVPQLDVSRSLLPRRPGSEGHISVYRQGGGDRAGIRADHGRQSRPIGARTKRCASQKIGTRLAISSAAMTDGAGMHDAIASANHETTMRVPCESNPRLKLGL